MPEDTDKETNKKSPEEDDFEEDNLEVKNDPVPLDEEAVDTL